MRKLSAFAVVVTLAFLMAGIYAQDNSGQKAPAQPGMGQMGPMGRMSPQMRERMKAHAEEMRAKRQKMMEEMKAEDEALQQKVDAMNAATGEQKINAMADVITELVKQRKTMREHMATMRGDMGGDMMGPMGGMGMMHGGMMHDMDTTGSMGMKSEPAAEPKEKE